MNNAKFFYLLLALLYVVPISAQEGKTDEVAESTDVDFDGDDEDWLNTVWTQVDGMVAQEELQKQEIVTVAGVRGAEAEDNILAKLYYKGGKRYPSQDKLVKAIKTLQEAINKNPKSPNAPKQKFFVAQCYEKLGKADQARDYYSQVVKDHPKSSYATKAQNKISKMSVQ